MWKLKNYKINTMELILLSSYTLGCEKEEDFSTGINALIITTKRIEEYMNATLDDPKLKKHHKHWASLHPLCSKIQTLLCETFETRKKNGTF